MRKPVRSAISADSQAINLLVIARNHAFVALQYQTAPFAVADDAFRTINRAISHLQGGHMREVCA